MSSLTSFEVLRYSRQILLPKFGINGQKLLKSASVLCVGSGGLGSSLLTYLAAAGLGKIGIVDYDTVDLSNLHRQIIHSTNTIGSNKTSSAKKRIKEINPNCHVEIFNIKINRSNIFSIFERYDYICDASDNFPTRYLVNDACVILGKPLIYGSIFQFEGQASVFNLTPKSPNLRDLVPSPPPPEMLPSCSEAGVLGVLPGLIGTIQATETIKLITGIGSSLDGRLLVFDALKMSFRELRLQQSDPPIAIEELIDYEYFCGINQSTSVDSISVSDLNQLMHNFNSSFLLVDVRSVLEREIAVIPNSISIPLSSIKDGTKIKILKDLVKGKKLIIYCQKGARSIQAIEELRKHDIQGVNLEGGIEEWLNNTDDSIPL